MKLAEFVTWALANKGEFLGDVSAVIGAASVLVASMAKLTDLLVTAFPKLKGVDGKLHWAVSWFGGLAQSPFLNAVAFNPKSKPSLVPGVPVLKAVLALLLVGAMIPAPAKAQALFSTGPTVPLFEVRPGNLHPVSLAPGAGYQLSMTFPGLQKAIGGKSWDLLDINAMAFGSSVSSSSGQTFGALSGALGLSTLSSMLFFGAGHDIITSSGGMGEFFFVFAFSFNFAVSPTAPPVGVSSGPLGLPRANTLFFGVG